MPGSNSFVGFRVSAVTAKLGYQGPHPATPEGHAGLTARLARKEEREVFEWRKGWTDSSSIAKNENRNIPGANGSPAGRRDA